MNRGDVVWHKFKEPDKKTSDSYSDPERRNSYVEFGYSCAYNHFDP